MMNIFSWKIYAKIFSPFARTNFNVSCTPTILLIATHQSAMHLKAKEKHAHDLIKTKTWFIAIEPSTLSPSVWHLLPPLFWLNNPSLKRISQRFSIHLKTINCRFGREQRFFTHEHMNLFKNEVEIEILNIIEREKYVIFGWKLI